MASRKRTLILPRLEIQDADKFRKVRKGLSASASVCDKCKNEVLRRRLKVTKGQGRYAKSTILCIRCGREVIEGLAEQLGLADSVLLTGQGKVYV